jgi:hypothetical protein
MLRYIAITSFVAISLFSAILYTSCTKTETDKCASVTCQHSGTCSGGICYCTSDYTGTNCEKRWCEVNNTAKIRFSNRSSNKTYTIVWDGVNKTSLGPGETSEYYTESADQHTLQFKYSNSSTEACTLSSPTLAQCSQQEIYCSN